MVMQLLQVGPNGELTLPLSVREALGLQSGGCVRLDADAVNHTAMITTENVETFKPRSDKKYTLDDLIGIGGRFHRTVTSEEMDEAIRRRAAERFLGE